MTDILYTIIIYPITQLLELTFVFSQKLFKESGISIIFISLAISVLCLPLYAVAEKWQQLERDIEKKLKSKVDTIKKVFTGDEQYMILSTYYRQNHYHPVYALRSTFGLLIQIPFFIAAYSYLSQLAVIKGVPFLFIRDLSAPDMLFSTNSFTVNVLPVVMTIINCIAGAIYTAGFPAKDKIQLYGMAAIFLILLYNSPSALVLYWTMNNVFSLLKNIYYRIQIQNKRYLLLALSSICCILLAVFCIFKYGPLSKGQKLAALFLCTALIPWIFAALKRHFSPGINLKYKPAKSINVFLLSIILIWSLFGFFIPSQLIASSPQEFSFIDNYTNPLLFIFYTALQTFGLFIFWPVCLYFLFSDNIKKYFSVIFLMLSVGILINVFLFPGNYGVISITFVYSGGSPDHSMRETLFNLCILFIISTVVFLLYRLKNKHIIPAVISICIFALTGITVKNIFNINMAFGELEKYYISKEEKDTELISPVFSLSKNGKNVIVIMLDRAINCFMPLIFEESPELKEIYSGFTLYPNTVSFNGYTRIGSPPVFGGYEYTPEEINKRADVPLVEKHNQSLLVLPLIFSKNDFSVCVTDPPYANYNQKSDLSIFDDYQKIKAYITDSQYTELWIKEHNMQLPETGNIIKKNLFWYSMVKGLPLFFREPLYMDGNWCSSISNNSLRLTINGYSVLDYLPRLTEITDEPVNTALIMTNNTTHEGSLLQAPEYVPVIAVTKYSSNRFSKEPAYHINAAAIKTLGRWFNYLKKENVYDNTRIILVSDHGPETNYITKTGLPFNVEQFNPLLMVKDFEASGEIRTDMTFMSNADVPYLALHNIVQNPCNPFTGTPISTEQKKNPLYIAISGSIHINGKTDTQFRLDPTVDYFIHDNIFDPKNWNKVTAEK